MILLTEGQSMSRLFDLDWQLIADSTLTIIAVGVESAISCQSKSKSLDIDCPSVNSII